MPGIDPTTLNRINGNYVLSQKKQTSCYESSSSAKKCMVHEFGMDSTKHDHNQQSRLQLVDSNTGIQKHARES